MNEFGIFFIVLAGIINASFVIPAKLIKGVPSEVVWLLHSIVSLVIIPWLLLCILFTVPLHFYSFLSASDLFILIVGGFLFGVGQTCFYLAIEKLGIALSFVINLGLGVTIGSLLAAVYEHVLLTRQGWIVIAAVALILLGLFLYYKSKGSLQKNTCSDLYKNSYILGWVFAVITGITSGLQNISFVIVSSKVHDAGSYWFWPPFLTIAAIPMFIGFYFFSRKLNKRPRLFHLVSYRVLPGVIVMGLCFTGSLALYSLGMSHLVSSQKVVGWPLLMIFTILTSQLWGKLMGEMKAYVCRQQVLVISSILIFIAAICLIGFSH